MGLIMFLKKIYSEPEVFHPVAFVNGINYIFGKKEVANLNEVKNSLNGIGKSTFLDLIDFALLANFNKKERKRLHQAYQKGILKGVSIILDFEIDNIDYSLKRSFDKPSLILFSVNNDSYKEFQIKNLKPILCDLVFKRNYLGIYSNSWLRQLLPFYIKIHSPEKELFTNPIKYIRESREIELNFLHFFLLDIDNTIAYKNFQTQSELSKLDTTIKEANNIIKETLGHFNMPDIESKLFKYKQDIEKLENSIKLFELSEKYKIDRDKLNLLTQEIKELIFLNSNDEFIIQNYKESLSIDVNIKPANIQRLYAEFNRLLADNIRKSLDDAVAFRNNLIKSRRDFIQNEIDLITSVINERENLINEKTSERANIFNILKTNEAITDLTEAHFTLNKLKEEESGLNNKIQIIKDLQIKRVKINGIINDIEEKILGFEQSIESHKFRFSKNFLEIYNALYPELDDTSVFNITSNFNSIAKIQFNILSNNEMLSKGRNQGRTLIYDLAVLFHSIDYNIKLPLFLIHDGILEGMDKTHFIELVKFLESKVSHNYRFQYIISLNEEGELTDNFGDADEVNPFKIEKEAVLVLTPNKLLFNRKF